MVSRIQATQAMKGVAKQMGTVVKGLDKAMGSMNLVEMSEIMDKFETQIDELDVIDQTMGQAMDSTTGSTVNPTAVDDLMKQMADDMGMEVGRWWLCGCQVETEVGRRVPPGGTVGACRRLRNLCARLRRGADLRATARH